MRQRNKIQRKPRPATSLAEIRWAEKHYGVKFICPELLIFFYDHIVWRPVVYESELKAARRGDTPILRLFDEMLFVPLTWSHFTSKR